MISFDNKRNVFVVKLFGKECTFVPKDKLHVYNVRNNKRKYEVLYTQVTNNGNKLPIHTVEDNLKIFTARQRKNAELAREAQMRMGFPSVRDIIDGIKGRILNLPITKSDLDNDTKIWGHDLRSVVGKTTRKTLDTVVIERSEPVTGQKYYTIHRSVLY